VIALSDRHPQIDARVLLLDLQAPPRFANARFDNYIPDVAYPSQAQARDAVAEFAQPVKSSKRGIFRRQEALTKPGVYLDGGYGVGKTHLLASLWHAHSGEATFASFVEYTNLVGALGFVEAVEALSAYSLICIDEFELDDPGDTVLMSTLLQRLVERGVKIAATSNTLPDRLGEGRFAAEDFMREIQGLKNHFNILRIEGTDYRHRENLEPSEPLTAEALENVAQITANCTLDDAAALQGHLSHVHPSAFGALVDGLNRVCIANLTPVTDQGQALRWVVFIDRLYDRQIPVSFSGCQITELFSAQMLKGGYRKKYLRALSRLTALSREV
jgi:cell division protein ZapE